MLTLIPLAVVVPLLTAAILAGARAFAPRALLEAIGIAVGFGVTAIAAALAWRASTHGDLVYWFGGWRPHDGIALGIAFVADPASSSLATLAGLLVTVSLLFSWRYFNTVHGLFPVLMLVFLAGLVGFCLSGDLFTLFVFFELMGTCAFALTAHKIKVPSIEGALTFAVINSIGAFLFLWGIALLYGNLGALNLAQLGRELAAFGPLSGLAVAALSLIASAFMVKAATVPFHFWHADADAVAPTPVCVLISGILAPLGVYGLARVYREVFAATASYSGAVWHVLLWFGLATTLLGALMCFRQRHMKRLLAFSTISHVGMMLVGFATGTVAGAAGAGLYLLGHGLVKGGLFLAVGVVLQRLNSVDEIGLHGRGRGHGMRWAAILFLLGGLGLAGMPPFATFTGKALMEAEGAREGYPWLPWLFTFAEALSAGAVLRAAARVFLGWGSRRGGSEEAAPTDHETRETECPDNDRTPVAMLLAPSVLIGLAVVLGLVPAMRTASQAAAVRFLDQKTYIAAVLDGLPTGPATIAHPAGIAWFSFILAAIAVAGAFALAALALWGDRLPRWLTWLIGHLIGAPMTGLERIHSGDIGDYAAWLVLGTAGVGVAFTLSVWP